MKDAPNTAPGSTLDRQQRGEKLVSHPLGVRSILTTRLLPESHTSFRQVPLSILDATSARFPPASAAWLYDQPADAPGRTALSVTQLQDSLQKTLNAYPQWAGQLQFINYKPGGDHTQRGGRVVLTYGGASDPGVELVIAHCPRSMPSLIPSFTERESGLGWWDAGEVPLEELLPEHPELALSDNNKSEFDGLPGVVIQLTTFDCGGVAIAVKIAHALADAQSMVQFVKDWARVNRSILARAPIPLLSPVFAPSLLDRAAAGDIDAENPDTEFIEAARALPIRHFDPPPSADGHPPSTPSTRIQLGLKDLGAPVGYYQVYFSPGEVQRIWEEASSPGTRVTRFEALVAFVWSLMMRNRAVEHDGQTVDMSVTFDVRPRLSPALPESFLGSPMLLARVTGTKSTSLQTLATSIRSSLAQFTSSTLSALLHAKAYEDSPQRIWAWFLQKRQTTLTYGVTSLLGLRMNKVHFGGGILPRHVEVFTPNNVDGSVHIMGVGEGGKQMMVAEGGRWYDECVSVSLHIKAEVMQSILQDPLLQKYRDFDRARGRVHRRFASRL